MKKPTRRPLIPTKAPSRALNPLELVGMGFNAMTGPIHEPLCWQHNCWSAAKWNAQVQLRLNGRTTALAIIFHCDLHKPGAVVEFGGRQCDTIQPPESETWRKAHPST